MRATASSLDERRGGARAEGVQVAYAHELLHDQTLDIDQGRNLLGILPVQVRQQARKVR